MESIYVASAISTGDGRNGHVTTADGLLDVDLKVPTEMGGPGGGLNPELLFAAGYAACFHNALRRIAKGEGYTLEDDSVTAEVGVDRQESGGLVLSARLRVEVPGVPRDVAEKVTAAAHQMCPYSNATRGNMDVEIEVVTD